MLPENLGQSLSFGPESLLRRDGPVQQPSATAGDHRRLSTWPVLNLPVILSLAPRSTYMRSDVCPTLNRLSTTFAREALVISHV